MSDTAEQHVANAVFFYMDTTIYRRDSNKRAEYRAKIMAHGGRMVGDTEDADVILVDPAQTELTTFRDDEVAKLFSYRYIEDSVAWAAPLPLQHYKIDATLRAPDRETGAAGVIIFVNRFVYQHDREKRTAFRETIKAAGPKFGWSTATNSDEATVILVDPAQPGVDAEDDLTILNKIYSYHFVDDSLGRGCRLSLVNYKINIPVAEGCAAATQTQESAVGIQPVVPVPVLLSQHNNGQHTPIVQFMEVQESNPDEDTNGVLAASAPIPTICITRNLGFGDPEVFSWCIDLVKWFTKFRPTVESTASNTESKGRNSDILTASSVAISIIVPEFKRNSFRGFLFKQGNEAHRDQVYNAIGAARLLSERHNISPMRETAMDTAIKAAAAEYRARFSAVEGVSRTRGPPSPTGPPQPPRLRPATAKAATQNGPPSGNLPPYPTPPTNLKQNAKRFTEEGHQWMRDIYRWFLLRKANESTKERSAEVAKMSGGQLSLVSFSGYERLHAAVLAQVRAEVEGGNAAASGSCASGQGGSSQGGSSRAAIQQPEASTSSLDPRLVNPGSTYAFDDADSVQL